MTTLEINGWQTGFRKVAFTHLLQQELGYGLRQAKDVTDAVLDGKVVRLSVTEDQAEGLLTEMHLLGARAAAVLHAVA